MFQITVTIGRNIGSVPMGSRAWAAFTRQAAANVQHATGLAPSLSFTYDGTGEWEGVTEESRHLVFLYEIALDPAIVADALRHNLANLATATRQDAIAFSVSESQLAYGA